MTRPHQPKPRTLTVRRTFEPSRMVPENLATAYEQLVPLVQRQLPAAPAGAGETPGAPKRRRKRRE
ncbi:MAG: hypothetical protein MI924_16075 [Chloroflexales bacterium]|nr:hypothetical protein [Chloroflexales bacterium]